MTRKQAQDKAFAVTDAIKANVADWYADQIDYAEFGRRQRALWASVEPQDGPPICGRRYPVLNRVMNLINGRDVDYGF